VFGALRLAAAAAEASSHETDPTGNVVEKLAPRDLEEDVPRLLASALTFARERGDTKTAKPFRGDALDDDAANAARSALDGVSARALNAAPRWAAGTFAALAIGVSVETRSVDGKETTDSVEAAALAASFVAQTHLRRARASSRGDGSLTTLSFETQTSRAKESALKCVSALRDAADALVRLGVAGAARAASAARDAERDVQDAFP
jgi:hypothetical protein